MLARQIDLAVDRGLLRQVEVLASDANSGGEYHPSERVIKLPLSLFANPTLTAFTLGHETQHALNGPVINSATARFHRTVGRAAIASRDYSTAVDNLIRANRWDESSANLVGWNAAVSYLHGSRRSLRWEDIVRAVPRSVLNDFVGGTAIRSGFHSDLRANLDFTLPLTPSNIEAMGRRFFDKSPKKLNLGARGTSDYANYYAAWAVSVAASTHRAANPGQPMRIDLERLGLSRKIMEENGIDLTGGRQQVYIDCSSYPPTRDVLHHTIGTFTYVPPTTRIRDISPDHAPEPLRLAMIGFARPATEAVGRRSHRAVEEGVASSRARSESAVLARP